jgi:hypothetical protein
LEYSNVTTVEIKQSTRKIEDKRKWENPSVEAQIRFQLVSKGPQRLGFGPLRSDHLDSAPVWEQNRDGHRPPKKEVGDMLSPVHPGMPYPGQLASSFYPQTGGGPLGEVAGHIRVS